MELKLPYYMAYPMPLQYDDEKLERRDSEYMKSLYPTLARRILPYVEDECERLEYECSIMYDEYPDKLMLRMISRSIYNTIIEREHIEAEYHDEVKDLIEVLTYQEMCKRRCKYRKKRRKYY